MQLYLLIELVIKGYNTVFLFLLSLVSIYLAIMTVTSNNPVVSVLYLIGLFASIAFYLMCLGLYFLGISYLLVYVGAISILFLFILMLINVRVSELLTEGINSAGLGIIVVVTLSFNLDSVLPYYLQISDAFSNYSYRIFTFVVENLLKGIPLQDYFNKLSLATDALTDTGSVHGSSWDGFLVETNHITSIGNILYSNLYILLIMISFVLLLAMVGTIVITLKRETNLKQINLQSRCCFKFISAFELFGFNWGKYNFSIENKPKKGFRPLESSLFTSFSMPALIVAFLLSIMAIPSFVTLKVVCLSFLVIFSLTCLASFTHVFSTQKVETIEISRSVNGIVCFCGTQWVRMGSSCTCLRTICLPTPQAPVPPLVPYEDPEPVVEEPSVEQPPSEQPPSEEPGGQSGGQSKGQSKGQPSK